MAMNPRLLRPLVTFDPRSIAGLAGWWDGADFSTFTLNGSNVTQWRNKSGTSRTLIQDTAARQPAYSSTAHNSKGGVTFDGGDSEFLTYSPLMFTFTGAATVFVVTKDAVRASNFNYGAYLAESTGSAAQKAVALLPGRFETAGIRPTTDVYGVHGRTADSTIDGTAASIFQYTWDNWSTHRSNAGLGVNNDSVAASSYGTLDPVNFTGDTRQGHVGRFSNDLSANSYLFATICEMLVYTVALTAPQRKSVRLYLGRKWAIPTT